MQELKTKIKISLNKGYNDSLNEIFYINIHNVFIDSNIYNIVGRVYYKKNAKEIDHSIIPVSIDRDTYNIYLEKFTSDKQTKLEQQDQAYLYALQEEVAKALKIDVSDLEIVDNSLEKK